jgi:hypothetical protein
MESEMSLSDVLLPFINAHGAYGFAEVLDAASEALQRSDWYKSRDDKAYGLGVAVTDLRNRARMPQWNYDRHTAEWTLTR